MWPDKKIMIGSYESEYAAELGGNIRDTIAENQASLRVRVTPSSSARHRWTTSIFNKDNRLVLAGGGVITAGRGGSFVGRGANVLIIDDPIKNAEEADSPIVREALWRWFESAVKTRLEPGAVLIIVTTRWHQDDLVGRIRERQEHPEYRGPKWRVVSFPAIAESSDELGRVPGDALWPERYNVQSLLEIKDGSDDWIWQSAYQQHPTNPAGVIFQKSWWDTFQNESGETKYRNRYDYDDVMLKRHVIARFQSWDTAFKNTRDSAYTSCVTIDLLDDYRVLLRDVFREKITFDSLPSTIISKAREWNHDKKLRVVVIEDKASGTSAYQTLSSSTEAEDIRDMLFAFQPSGDKIQRAKQASVWCRNNCVLFPYIDGVPWWYDFSTEFFTFPGSKTADQVDAFSQAIIYLENFISSGYRSRNATRLTNQEIYNIEDDTAKE